MPFINDIQFAEQTGFHTYILHIFYGILEQSRNRTLHHTYVNLNIRVQPAHSVAYMRM